MADVNIDINLIAKQALAQMKKLEKESKKTEKGFSKLSKSVIVLNQGLALGQKVYGALSGAISAVTEAAAIQEAAINELEFALASAGDASKESSRDFQAFASELQTMTTFGDEATLSAAALFAQLTKMTGEGLKQATIAAQNMSAALGVDLNTSMRLIAKASEDGGSGLKRYNVVVEKGATGAETLTNAITAVNSQFAGVAASKVETYAGATTQLSNAWGDLLEGIGSYLTKSPVMIEAIKALTGWIVEAGDGIGTFTERLVGDDLDKAKDRLKELQDEIKLTGTTVQEAIFLPGVAGLGAAPIIADTKAQIIEGSAEIEELKVQIEAEEEERRKEKIKTRNADREQAERDHQAALKLEKERSVAEFLKIDFKAASDRANFDKLTGKQKVENFKSTANTIASLSTANNKVLAVIGKAGAISVATIDGIAAVQKALASAPPPFNFALAGLVGVATAANVAKIAGVKMASGGIVPGTDTGQGDTVPAMLTPQEVVLNAAMTENLAESMSGNITVNIAAGVVKDNDTLIDQIVDGINNGTEFRNLQLQGAA